jgi:hypothetical protein
MCVVITVITEMVLRDFEPFWVMFMIVFTTDFTASLDCQFTSNI